jgi:hypothetical protein
MRLHLHLRQVQQLKQKRRAKTNSINERLNKEPATASRFAPFRIHVPPPIVKEDDKETKKQKQKKQKQQEKETKSISSQCKRAHYLLQHRMYL